MPNLKARLKRSRENLGISQMEVSRRTGINNKTLSGYERGISEPDTETLSLLARLYNVTTDYLINGDVSPIDKKVSQAQSNPYIDKKREKSVMGETYPMGRIVQVRIVAEISCGEPVFAESNVLGQMGVDTQFVPIKPDSDEYVYLRAVGDSMINASIRDGSMVLIRLQNAAESGDIVAACVDNEKATLKRIYYGNGVITLAPENPSMRPVNYEPYRIRVVGKAVWVATHL